MVSPLLLLHILPFLERSCIFHSLFPFLSPLSSVYLLWSVPVSELVIVDSQSKAVQRVHKPIWSAKKKNERIERERGEYTVL